MTTLCNSHLAGVSVSAQGQLLLTAAASLPSKSVKHACPVTQPRYHDVRDRSRRDTNRKEEQQASSVLVMKPLQPRCLDRIHAAFATAQGNSSSAGCLEDSALLTQSMQKQSGYSHGEHVSSQVRGHGCKARNCRSRGESARVTYCCPSDLGVRSSGIRASSALTGSREAAFSCRACTLRIFLCNADARGGETKGAWEAEEAWFDRRSNLAVLVFWRSDVDVDLGGVRTRT